MVQGTDTSRQVPGIQEMLTRLISLPSISSASADWDHSNEAVVRTLAEWLEPMGFTVEILEVPGMPGKYNLIATLGSGPGGLVLSGHTDTVPFDDKRWQSDPFTLTEKDNRWYGLGTCDMKGFFPLAIEAAKAFVDQPLQQPLIILATADEESSMNGARALAEAGKPKARYAVIGEPTSLQPVRMHKGIMMERLKFEGQSGHSSDPGLGRNALEGMHEAMGELLSLRQQWQSQYQNPNFRVQVPTMNLGCIHGGDNPNRICAQCELHFDLRPLPGMDMAGLRQAILDRLQPVAERRELGLTFEPLFDGVPPFETPADAALVKACEKLTGHTAHAVAFATEAPWLQKLGMETLVMGPGSIDQAHQPDEYLELSQLEPTLDILRGLIKQFCLEGKEA
ncbi:acetylornithine deacetylase [Marinobacter persicus]|uniref:Acetylornithine deacetylase n=1 Tax=Marinobacter persicus TaxID=930118 RepID=A0A2S6G2J9_9GAMM|nr:acetylornithine deacetylase [Marinobacter persicus]KXS53375.1 MAG: acetylornithine deacetylase [Marinobacter sp. T13-3]PPK50012.1 acetylornithine deacetylase [Marinobacter persicus]PPK52058.1 acetylornithine deacetylase [Marinobacter persicus]PPK56589.1 acetylornithine deacetylase [Marinobacter persicus]